MEWKKREKCSRIQKGEGRKSDKILYLNKLLTKSWSSDLNEKQTKKKSGLDWTIWIPQGEFLRVLRTKNAEIDESD